MWCKNLLFMWSKTLIFMWSPMPHLIRISGATTHVALHREALSTSSAHYETLYCTGGYLTLVAQYLWRSSNIAKQNQNLVLHQIDIFHVNFFLLQLAVGPLCRPSGTVFKNAKWKTGGQKVHSKLTTRWQSMWKFPVSMQYLKSQV